MRLQRQKLVRCWKTKPGSSKTRQELEKLSAAKAPPANAKANAKTKRPASKRPNKGTREKTFRNRKAVLEQAEEKLKERGLIENKDAQREKAQEDDCVNKVRSL